MDVINTGVIISAHFDSIANFDPEIDPAPGTDDDGSGVAGVLAVAKTIKELSQLEKQRKTIHFVLFNAEEQGLVENQEYARDEAQADALIVALYQYYHKAKDLQVGFEYAADIACLAAAAWITAK